MIPVFNKRIIHKGWANTKTPYAKGMYKIGKGYLAFFSDVLRVELLKKYGGIYSDVDCLLLKPIQPVMDMVEYAGAKGFAFLDFNNKQVNFGLPVMARQGNQFIDEILSIYQELPVVFKDGMPYNLACTFIDTAVFMKHGFVPSKEIQLIDNMLIFPNEWFNPTGRGPFDPPKKQVVNSAAIGTHLYNLSWMDNPEKKLIYMIREEPMLHLLNQITGVEQISNWSISDAERYYDKYRDDIPKTFDYYIDVYRKGG